ncbi:hypothetical protein [Paenibacillus kandeliae]|uniref:hypothetical protein n=1 Tax=Paenibacillus kandeliae TaxID=3231269 RepID=UPI00345A63B7
MHETNFDPNFKKVMITVNGEPVGNGLVIDRITYAPVREHELANEAAQKPTAPML